MNEQATGPEAARHDAKRLLRLARTGALATLDNAAPLTTLVGVASDWDGAPLFLMSELSRHTRNVGVDPRVSLLLTSNGGRGDPLNQPRVTLNGVVRRREGADGRKRYIQRNPKAKLYVDFTDFSVRRLDVETVHFNGGFGRADPLAWSDIASPPVSALLLEAEEELLASAAGLGDERLARLARARGTWKPIGVDAEGLDLGRSGDSARVDFDEAAADPTAWWASLQAK